MLKVKIMKRFPEKNPEIFFRTIRTIPFGNVLARVKNRENFRFFLYMTITTCCQQSIYVATALHRNERQTVKCPQPVVIKALILSERANPVGVCKPSRTRVYGQKGATGATSLIIRHLRCNIWRNICATGVQHFTPSWPKPSDRYLRVFVRRGFLQRGR